MFYILTYYESFLFVYDFLWERRKDHYAKHIREQKVGRGELSTGVRPSFKRARLRLRQGLAEGQDGSDSGDAASGLSEEELDDAQDPSALTQNVVKVPARGSLSQRSETKQPKKNRRKRALVTSSDESDESEEETRRDGSGSEDELPDPERSNR